MPLYCRSCCHSLDKPVDSSVDGLKSALVRWTVSRADLIGRLLVRVEKIGRESKHTLLSLGSYGPATGARRSIHANYRGRKRCDGCRGRSSVSGVWIPVRFPGELIKRPGRGQVMIGEWTRIGIRTKNIDCIGIGRLRWAGGYGRCCIIRKGGKGTS